MAWQRKMSNSEWHLQNAATSIAFMCGHLAAARQCDRDAELDETYRELMTAAGHLSVRVQDLLRHKHPCKLSDTLPAAAWSLPIDDDRAAQTADRSQETDR